MVSLDQKMITVIDIHILMLLMPVIGDMKTLRRMVEILPFLQSMMSMAWLIYMADKTNLFKN
jgi:hypothetical protein